MKIYKIKLALTHNKINTNLKNIINRKHFENKGHTQRCLGTTELCPDMVKEATQCQELNMQSMFSTSQAISTRRHVSEKRHIFKIW